MNSSNKGMTNERKAKNILEARGYSIERRIRGRFTHDFYNLYDLMGFHPDLGWILAQITTNVNKPPAFRKLIQDHKVPVGTSKQIWIFKDRVKEPIIHLFD